MKITIDRTLAISIHQQLKGAIEHAMAFGALGAGEPLPSVRDLAAEVGVAPMTVSKVYGELKAEGRIEARSGSGTFVAQGALGRIAQHDVAPRLRNCIDAAIDLALKTGLKPADILAMINARVTYRLGAGLRRDIVMVGLFRDATASYARAVEKQVGHLAAIEPATMDRLAADDNLRARIAAADLVLTFANLEDDIRRLLPDVNVLSLRFIPSEETRLALASIDPMARVGVVSRFADFLPILSLGVRRFAAHLQGVTTLVMDDPALPAKLADCDVLILSTGAEAAARLCPDAQKIEYRHIPDPGDVDRLVIPFITKADDFAERGRKEAS
ncbi:MAG: GntR family transcriptional regulator [Paracoccaceae bacterium]|jgi:DNA-binding transcriptional regulator YhcF (GntR family)|nr:GntR family transcriptional regulator [Rhodobacter sp.]